MPHRSARPGCSRSHSAAMPHANTGLSDTSTTELATVVNRSDAIQDQKWRARSRPDNVIKGSRERGAGSRVRREVLLPAPGSPLPAPFDEDRKSTRLNSSHGYISYAVFCLKKKTTTTHHVDHFPN